MHWRNEENRVQTPNEDLGMEELKRQTKDLKTHIILQNYAESFSLLFISMSTTSQRPSSIQFERQKHIN